MWLSRLEIQNYKSLRDVVIEPGPLSVFVGPNAAGKSNLADAIDFLGDVYRLGLEYAVARKGGYENLSFRQVRRSRSPIRFRVVIRGAMTLSLFEGRSLSLEAPNLTIDHTFEFRTQTRGIQSPFSVSAERFILAATEEPGHPEILRVNRQESGVDIVPGEVDFLAEYSVPAPGGWDLLRNLLDIEAAQKKVTLAASVVRQFLGWLLEGHFQMLESMRVFQLSPRVCRGEGVPTPNPQLDRFGGNLPAAVEYLKKNHPAAHDAFLETAKLIIPSIEDITTGFTHTKTLGLFVKEAPFDRPWPAEDISDGTIQILGLLAAIFDPRSKLVVIEEPENSIHPWAIRNFVQAARKAAETKQIFITTHSPVLLNQLQPEEIWIVQRPAAETKIDPLLKLDPALLESWKQGEFLLSDYLDSGAIPAAVPTIRS